MTARDEGDQKATAVMRWLIKTRFPAGPLSDEEMIGYYAVAHAAWHLQDRHPTPQPPGCWWRLAFWGAN